MNDALELPVELPYRMESLGAISAIVFVWTLPDFQAALSRQVEDDPDLPVHSLLRELGMFGPMAPSLVADHFGMSRSNVSKIVNRAVARGLIERMPHPADGRSVRLSLTPTGRELAARTLQVGDAMMAELTQEWDPQDLETWTVLTRRLSVAAGDYARRIMRDDAPTPPED